MPDRMIIDVLEQWRVWQHKSIGYVLPQPRAIRPRVLILQLGSSNSKSPRNGFRCVRSLTIITNSSNVVTNLLIQATQLLNLNGIPCIRLSFHHTFLFTRIELQSSTAIQHDQSIAWTLYSTCAFVFFGFSHGKTKANYLDKARQKVPVVRCLTYFLVQPTVINSYSLQTTFLYSTGSLLSMRGDSLVLVALGMSSP